MAAQSSAKDGHEIMDSSREPGSGFSEDEETSHKQLDAKDMYRMGKDQQFRVSSVNAPSWLLLMPAANLPAEYDDYVHQHGPMHLGDYSNVRGRLCG